MERDSRSKNPKIDLRKDTSVAVTFREDTGCPQICHKESLGCISKENQGGAYNPPKRKLAWNKKNQRRIEKCLTHRWGFG